MNALCHLSEAPFPAKLLPIFDRAGFTKEDVILFGRALLRSGAKSVDTFLAQRREFSDIGKVAIACELCPREDAAKFGPGLDDHWYMHLWDRMITGVQRGPDIPDANRLSVITFNYDRSLEFFLYNGLRHYYAASESDAQAILNQLSIMHMYGSLGRFSYAGYGPPQQPQQYVVAAQGIKVIADERADSPDFVEARRWITEADAICFVGFGFDPLNLDRLQVARAMNDRPNRPYVCASVCGMSKAEVDRAKAQIVPNFDWTTRDMVNLAFLRDVHVLI